MAVLLAPQQAGPAHDHSRPNLILCAEGPIFSATWLAHSGLAQPSAVCQPDALR